MKPVHQVHLHQRAIAVATKSHPPQHLTGHTPRKAVLDASSGEICSDCAGSGAWGYGESECSSRCSCDSPGEVFAQHPDSQAQAFVTALGRMTNLRVLMLVGTGMGNAVMVECGGLLQPLAALEKFAIYEPL